MARVIVDNRFRRLQRDAMAEIAKAVDIAAASTAVSARGVAAASHYDLNAITDKIVAYPARPSRRGITAVVMSPDYRSWWFETGTYQKLGARRSRRGRAAAAEGNRGVKPVKFMRKGLAVGRRILEYELRRRLS